MALKNVTITLDENLLQWAKERAAGENISVARLIARIVEEERWAAFERSRRLEAWRALKRIPGLADGPKVSREELNERP